MTLPPGPPIALSEAQQRLWRRLTLVSRIVGPLVDAWHRVGRLLRRGVGGGAVVR